jgi:hypothetical protein
MDLWRGDRFWRTVEGTIEWSDGIGSADMPGEDVTKCDGKEAEVGENV